MSELIGDKNNFAIELDVESLTPHPFGSLRIWLGGRPVGAFYDSHMLKASLYQIQNVLNRPLTNIDCVTLNPESLFRKIKELGLGEYFLNIGESFDDFSIIVCEYNCNYYFIWKLHNKPFFEYINYPLGVQSHIVSREVIKYVIEETERSLN